MNIRVLITRLVYPKSTKGKKAKASYRMFIEGFWRGFLVLGKARARVKEGAYIRYVTE